MAPCGAPGMDSILSLSCSLDGDKKKTEWSLLENVKPPADMDDVVDLDNSMMSVASLKSEIAETPPSQRRITPKQRRDLGSFRSVTLFSKDHCPVELIPISPPI